MALDSCSALSADGGPAATGRVPEQLEFALLLFLACLAVWLAVLVSHSAARGGIAIGLSIAVYSGAMAAFCLEENRAHKDFSATTWVAAMLTFAVIFGTVSLGVMMP